MILFIYFVVSCISFWWLGIKWNIQEALIKIFWYLMALLSGVYAYQHYPFMG